MQSQALVLTADLGHATSVVGHDLGTCVLVSMTVLNERLIPRCAAVYQAVPWPT